jgi:hypothetical protein
MGLTVYGSVSEESCRMSPRFGSAAKYPSDLSHSSIAAATSGRSQSARIGPSISRSADFVVFPDARKMAGKIDPTLIIGGPLVTTEVTGAVVDTAGDPGGDEGAAA